MQRLHARTSRSTCSCTPLLAPHNAPRGPTLASLSAASPRESSHGPVNCTPVEEESSPTPPPGAAVALCPNFHPGHSRGGGSERRPVLASRGAEATPPQTLPAAAFLPPRLCLVVELEVCRLREKIKFIPKHDHQTQAGEAPLPPGGPVAQVPRLFPLVPTTAPHSLGGRVRTPACRAACRERIRHPRDVTQGPGNT